MCVLVILILLAVPRMQDDEGLYPGLSRYNR